MLDLTLPMRVVSEANMREHWARKAKRAKQQRWVAKMAVNRKPLPSAPGYTSTLTRLASRKLDSDNLAGAFKAVRDGIADALGIDDGSERLEWLYQQEKAKRGSYAIRIEISSNCLC